ncbi:MAG: RagB/SusD family nutrient uptake outer membrane protein, partial [Bacteroidota bacterium]
NIPLSSAQEVVDFYRADLRYAFQHLPAEYENENVGRVTKGAASAFLGKSFLYQGEYDSAILRFEDVINNAEYGYRLVDDPSLMFSAAGEHNRESIYEINYGDNDLYYPERNNFDDENFYNRWDWMCLAGRGIKVPAWLAYAYRTEVIDTTDFRNTLYREVDLPDPDGDEDEFDTVIDTVQRTVSMRASSMVTLVEDDLVPYFINGAAAHNGRFTWDGWGFSQFKKYSNWDVDTGSEDGLNNSTKNVTVLRLAEVYLMLAECYIQVGNTQQALSMVNANRARWGLRQLGIDNNVSGPMFDGYNYLADPDSLMNFIMFHEKPLELSMEGFAVRPIDFRRWNVGKQVFNRLANSTFYMADHSYRLWRSRELSVNTASSVVVDPALSGGPVIDFEYDLAAEGYDPTVHSWFPIPLQEVIVNNKID